MLTIKNDDCRIFVCGVGVAAGSPVGGLMPTPGEGRTALAEWLVQHAKKKPVTAYELFLKYGGEEGIDSRCSP